MQRTMSTDDCGFYNKRYVSHCITTLPRPSSNLIHHTPSTGTPERRNAVLSGASMRGASIR